jgi:hypothetical protein
MGRRKGSKNGKVKTHCKHGHELTIENLYVRIHKNGREERHCRTCIRRNLKKYKKSIKGKAAEKRYADSHKNYFALYRSEHKAERIIYFAKKSRTLSRRYMSHKYVAKRTKREFTLTLDEYIKIVEANTCHYCGGVLPQTGGGLDRQDNRKDYHLENVVACCWPCNKKKGCLENAGFTFPRNVELLEELIRDTRRSNLKVA